MRAKDGFTARVAALSVALAALAGCGAEPAKPAQDSSAARQSIDVPRISFESIDLPQAPLTVSRRNSSGGFDEILRLNVKIADDIQSRAHGLMGVEALPASSGMAFLFYRFTQGGFHMKNTLIPLDIAFWAEDGTIQEIMHMTPCKTEPCRTYEPKQSYTGALEVRGGLLKRAGVKAGDKVDVSAPGQSPVAGTAEQG